MLRRLIIHCLMFIIASNNFFLHLVWDNNWKSVAKQSELDIYFF